MRRGERLREIRHQVFVLISLLGCLASWLTPRHFSPPSAQGLRPHRFDQVAPGTLRRPAESRFAYESAQITYMAGRVAPAVQIAN
jgi:hypothetical protein